MVMTPRFQCRGVSSIPGQRAKTPKAMRHNQKKKKNLNIPTTMGIFLPTTCKTRCVEQAILITQKVLKPRPLGALKGTGGKDDWVISANCSHLYSLLLLPKKKEYYCAFSNSFLFPF